MSVTRRKKESKTEKDDEKHDSENKNATEEKIKPKYGPLPKLGNHRVWSRAVFILGLLLYVWYTSRNGKETPLAKQKQILSNRGQSVACDPDYIEEIRHFPGCIPKKCGRFVTDKLVSAIEADALLNVAKKGMNFGDTEGGASILDLHSGALTFKDKFVNIYTLDDAKKFISPADLAIYNMVKDKIRHAIAENFGIDSATLHLTHPTFFSRLTSVDAKTIHDEYWHIHVDKVTYESFHYTSLLYLTDYNADFKGGRFIFVDNVSKPHANVTVEPRKGRVLMFSSGAENPHFVEKVTNGVRYAITVSFTCDKSVAISDLMVRN